MQLAALIVGAVFLIIGILGFVPGITTDYDDLSFVGHDGAQLLGLFEVNILHNIVHALFGVGILMAATPMGARAFLVGGGAIYGVVFLYGLLVDHDSDANFIAINDADNWLHLGLTVGMIALGLLLPGGDRNRTTTATA